MKNGHLAAHPKGWIRRIASEILALDTIPLFGNAPSFDWEAFSSLLCDALGQSGFSVSAKEQRWCSENELSQGLGNSPLIIPIHVSPLPVPLYFAMSLADRGKLIRYMLGEGEKKASFSSKILQEGFYRFLLVQTLEAAASLDVLKGLTLHIGDEASWPESKAFCIDISIALGAQNCWAKLAVTPEFRKHWVDHFSAFPIELSSSALSKNLELSLGIKVGSIFLMQKEWKKVKKGDFILIDQINFDLYDRNGSVIITLQSKPLFNATIDNNELELSDYAFIQEDFMEHSNQPLSHQLEMAEEESAAIKDLPLHIHVELARIKMPLSQLMALSPGNVLELPVLPEENVSLSVNGQKIGRGELVYLGEKLGIRILEMG